jgi:hypothetical protein
MHELHRNGAVVDGSRDLKIDKTRAVFMIFYESDLILKSNRFLIKLNLVIIEKYF